MRTRVPLLGLLLAAILAGQETSAWELYEMGREAEKAGHMAQAYLYYSQAVAKDPKNTTYVLRSRAVQTRAALEAHIMPSLPATGSADDNDSAEETQAPDDATFDDLNQAKRVLPPTALDVQAPLGDYDLTGDSRTLFEQMAKQLGLDCVFDGDYTPTASFHFKLDQVDYRTALHGLEAATGSFIIPLSPKLFMVAKDTPLKRTELQPRASVSIPLPETITQQDFNGVVTAVQQVLSIEKISFDTGTRTVIIRDILPKVVAARALFNDLMRPRPQVMVDVKIIEANRNDMITYGVNFPNYFSLTPLTNWLNNPVSVANTLSGLLQFGGGKTLLGLGIMTPNLVAQMTKAKGSNLLDASVQAADGQPATFKVGERYPVMTSGYFGPSNFSQGGTVYTPPPSFSFEDLGLSLKVTPVVHNMENVSLDIDAEFKVLTSTSINGIPVIGNEAVKTGVMMKAGEWAVVGGLLTVSQAKTITGVAGLSRIPVLGPLTDTYTNTENSDEVLILFRPRLLTIPPGAMGPTRSLGVGSETRPATLL